MKLEPGEEYISTGTIGICYFSNISGFTNCVNYLIILFRCTRWDRTMCFTVQVIVHGSFPEKTQNRRWHNWPWKHCEDYITGPYPGGGGGPVVQPPSSSTKVHFFRLLILHLFQNFWGQAPNSPGLSSLVHISSQTTPPKSELGTGLHQESHFHWTSPFINDHPHQNGFSSKSTFHSFHRPQNYKHRPTFNS